MQGMAVGEEILYATREIPRDMAFRILGFTATSALSKTG